MAHFTPVYKVFSPTEGGRQTTTVDYRAVFVLMTVSLGFCLKQQLCCSTAVISRDVWLRVPACLRHVVLFVCTPGSVCGVCLCSSLSCGYVITLVTSGLTCMLRRPWLFF